MAEEKTLLILDWVTNESLPFSQLFYLLFVCFHTLSQIGEVKQLLTDNQSTLA